MGKLTAPRAWCPGCGEEFASRMCGGARMRFCSRHCVDAHSKRITTEVRAIQRIGARLRAEAARIRRAQREASAKTATVIRYAQVRPCVRCGAGVRSAQAMGKPRDRCDACRAEKNAEVKRIGNMVRRARTKGRTADRVDPIRVFERDGWRCNYCKRATPRELRGTLNPIAPELDHFVPLAMAGDHTYDNVVCACRQCNQEKGSQSPGTFMVSKGMAISFPITLRL